MKDRERQARSGEPVHRRRRGPGPRRRALEASDAAAAGAVAQRRRSFPARTPTLPPATHTNSYALGGARVLLVEPATPVRERAARVDRAGRARCRRRGAPRGDRAAPTTTPTTWAAPRCSRASWAFPSGPTRETAARIDVPVDRTLADGDVLELDGPSRSAGRCCTRPGHAPGHVCLSRRGRGHAGRRRHGRERRHHPHRAGRRRHDRLPGPAPPARRARRASRCRRTAIP